MVLQSESSIPFDSADPQDGVAPRVPEITAPTPQERAPSGCGLSRLPLELWDAIILDGHPKSMSTVSWEYPPRDWWILCSLVCRQWRRIALRYLFRRVWTAWSGRKVREYSDFFAKNEDIACLVQHLHVSDQVVEIEDLCTLLASLPRIRSLHLICTHFKRGIDSSVSLPHPSFTLEYLQWNFPLPKEEPALMYDCIFHVLSLFSVIDLLSLSSNFETEPKVPNGQDSHSNSGSAPGRPLVHALSLGCGAPMTSFLLDFLFKFHCLDRLTELKLSVNNPLRITSQLKALLCATGGVLRFLHLDMTCALTWVHTELPRVHRREDILAEFGQGLSACSRLEEFSLSATIFDIEGNPDVCPQSWLAVDEIFQLVPMDHLRRLNLNLSFLHTPPDITHSLSWHSLRRKLRRLPQLSVLTARFSAYRDSIVVSCARCIEFELREFRSILRNGHNKFPHRCLCNNSECQKFAEENEITEESHNAFELFSDQW